MKSKIWNCGCNTAGRSTFKRIYHDHDFHQGVIGWHGSGLQHENVFTSHVLEDFHHDFAVAETTDSSSTQSDIEMSHYIFGKLGIRIAGKHHHAIVRHDCPFIKKQKACRIRTLYYCSRAAWVWLGR